MDVLKMANKTAWCNILILIVILYQLEAYIGSKTVGSFTFDRVFWPKSTQGDEMSEIYQEVEQLVNSLS
jgi:hypothetical protein